MPTSGDGPELNPTIPTEEWNLRFLAEFARMLAKRPGTELDPPGDISYQVEELALVGGHVTLVWSFPGVANDGGGTVRAGRFMDLAELRGGFSPDSPDIVAEAMLLNDFYPASPPSAAREQADGIRWLGPPPPA